MRAASWAFILAAAAVPSAGAAAACDDLLPAEPAPGAAARALSPDDLVRLRDIGPVDPEPQDSPAFTLSPDGRRAAFQLRRADPRSNGYCLAMAVVDLGPGARPRIVDRGGELLLVAVDARRRVGVATGIPRSITPRWSPDGRWIAFLKRQDGATQVWRAATDGSGGFALTRATDDVVDFRISADGSTLLYATRPGIARGEAAIAREALVGFHYDERFAPVASSRPFVPLPADRQVFALDLRTGGVSEAAGAEAAALAAATGLVPLGTEAPADPAQNPWISALALTGGAQPGSLHARTPDGAAHRCTAAACAGAQSPWLTPEGRVRFLRREGWARAATAIYEWAPGRDAVRRLYLTDDVLADCAPTGRTLVCLREASLQPRRLERLDPDSGARELLFDPNPEFAALSLGQAERLHWRNAQGLEVAGDLVRPVGHRPGTRVPLVVVQYRTRGFLRGGTGDEYPIQAFANRGYAVLSVGRPEAVALRRGATSFAEGNRLNLAGFADRRSALSAVEAGVRLAIARGLADPDRIGITGLSNGATTTISALIHSELFAAAAISTCCMDTTLAMRVGPAAAAEFRATGYPGLLRRDDPFWREISLAVNARRIATPLLLQLADDEYLSALESYTALDEAEAPVDMFVFPDEHHVKWQPAHRLAVYRRALDWFDYWLRGVRSAAPDRQDELREWDRLRARLPGRPSGADQEIAGGA